MEKITVSELKQIDVDGGVLIDGFPSTGVTNAVATESIIHATQLELVGVLDSDGFPPISIIKNGEPNYPTRIYANQELKVAVFSSYLTLHQSMQRDAANVMLDWAKKHGISHIVSSATMKTKSQDSDIIAVASTKRAKEKVRESGIKILEHGTIPGIPAILLNEGARRNIDVIVILYKSQPEKPDFKATIQLCEAFAKIVPGTSCNLEMLQKEAKIAEQEIEETEQEAKTLRNTMYR